MAWFCIQDYLTTPLENHVGARHTALHGLPSLFWPVSTKEPVKGTCSQRHLLDESKSNSPASCGSGLERRSRCCPGRLSIVKYSSSN